MSTQFFLDETDIEALTKLMLRSQQLRTREALCIKIEIDPRRLWFIKDSSDSDFVIQLINHLNEISNKKALCKLCCEELFPIFCNSENHTRFLRDIAAKLHCTQKFSNNYSNSSNTQNLTSTEVLRNGSFNQLVKNKLITGGTILLIGLAGFSLFNQNKNSNSPSTKLEVLEANNSRGITIPGKQGQIVTIEAWGRVHTHLGGTVSDCDKWTGPEGIPECHYATSRGFLPYDQPFMALVGKFEGEPDFPVGNMYTYKFKNTGTLQLIINDTNHDGNAGNFQIKITITN
jgi:hypothetical protein